MMPSLSTDSQPTCSRSHIYLRLSRASWEGYDCTKAKSSYGYTDAEEQLLLEECKYSCGQCEKMTNFPTAAKTCFDNLDYVSPVSDEVCSDWM